MTLVEYKRECEQVVKGRHRVSNENIICVWVSKICCQRYLSSGSQSVFLADHRKSTEVFQRLPAWGRSLHQRHPQQENYRSNLVLDRLGLWESNAELYTSLYTISPIWSQAKQPTQWLWDFLSQRIKWQFKGWPCVIPLARVSENGNLQTD